MSNETQDTQLEIHMVCFISEEKKTWNPFISYSAFFSPICYWTLSVEDFGRNRSPSCCLLHSFFFLFITSMMVKNHIDSKCMCVTRAVSLCPPTPSPLIWKKLVGWLLMADWELCARIHYILSQTAVSAFTGGTNENHGISRAGPFVPQSRLESWNTEERRRRRKNNSVTGISVLLLGKLHIWHWANTIVFWLVSGECLCS